MDRRWIPRIIRMDPLPIVESHPHQDLFELLSPDRVRRLFQTLSKIDEQLSFPLLDFKFAIRIHNAIALYGITVHNGTKKCL